MDFVFVTENVRFDDADSDISDLTDNFEEFHINSFLRKNAVSNRKYLTKNEADWITVEHFSDEFKRVMKDVRSTMNVSSSYLY